MKNSSALFSSLNQKGFSIVLLLVIWTSVLGLLLYVLIAATAPLASKTTNLVFQRKASNASASTLIENKFEGEKFEILTSGVIKTQESTASGQQILTFNNNSSAIGMVEGKAKSLKLKANGESCNGDPHILITIDGENVFNNFIKSKSWNEYSIEKALEEGRHIFTISFDNDFYDKNCDRSLKIDYIFFE